MSRDYKKEYDEYHSKPQQKKNRAKRNKANRNSDCGPGQEVDHKVPLSKGGSNSPSNWRVVSKETNRKKGTKKMSSFDKLRLAIAEKTAAPDGVERLPSGGIKYRDESFPGYNKPKAAPKGSKHKKRVLAKKGDKVKVVNFGARGYKHNYSAKAKKSYLARSAGIKGKDDKFSANYWSRRELWPKNQKADGSSKKRSKSAFYVPVMGTGAGALGQYQARKTLEEAGLTDSEISQVSTMGGGALRGLGKTLGYGAGGSIIGGLIGAGLDTYNRTEEEEKLLAKGMPVYPGNTFLGSMAGTLLGSGYGMYRAYADEIEDAKAELEKRKKLDEKLEKKLKEKLKEKTASKVEKKFDPSAYTSSLSLEDRKKLQEALLASTSSLGAEMQKELAPINKELQEAYAPYRERFKAVADKYNDRMYEAMLSGFKKGGASEDYLNYIRSHKDDFRMQAGVKLSSADDTFDTSSLEAFMRSVKNN